MLTRHRVEHYRLYLYLLMLASALFGLVISPPVLSVGLIGIVVLGLLDPLAGINPAWRAGIARHLGSPVPLALIALYLLLLFGWWQTEDWPYYFERLRIKVPLLSLPIVWPGLPKLSDRLEGAVFGGFGLFVGLVLGGVIINYGLHFEEINNLIRMGQSVPVPRNHIRFSLLVAIAALLAVRARGLRAFGWRNTWWYVAGFLFLGLHLLAVRSGLVGAYAGALVLGLASAWRRGRWLPAAAVIGGLCVLPVVAYIAVPSFQTKLDYVRYELFHRNAADDELEYSDEGRLTSIRVGWSIFRDHPVVGVGPGNMLAATDRRYAEILPGKKGKRPHNQFVSALAGSGVIGGVVTIGVFIVLFLVGLRRRDAVFLAVVTVFFLSCLVENTLENTVGVSAFSLLLLLIWEPGVERKKKVF
ncbi:O-antigen ligase family protein [Neolewinella antarctica]|uniref:O-antigen ligase n=1 Tax=Neolewinella antarctica TaxID=442734 RepID=A0ABX0XBS3_9BACT|nr:O-antigen ligase family protein [Neolewinella antarctica]NJC26222.1 O-antigen ligase [Neolewinella antarctica]